MVYEAMKAPKIIAEEGLEVLGEILLYMRYSC